MQDIGEKYKIANFDMMIDWGWFGPITRLMFWLLESIKGLVGNFGIAILVTTVLVKLAVFPLANKSYASMSKMKKLAPELMKLKELYPDDKMKQQQGMMEIYKREKVSPASGCLPVFVQIPIFFSLYKVILTSIELRHAPFYGWIHDLSAADPTNLFTLFGLIHWSPPHLLHLGIWPILMGITMWVQMRLNPTPPDPVQASMFNWMPVLFTFMLGSFPVGLVIYWAWSNLLGILQQGYIMKKHGTEIDLLGNIRESLPFLKKKTRGRVSQRFTSEQLAEGRRLFSAPSRFMLGVAALEQVPPPRGIEVAIAGRSNVGKSSLINALTGVRGLARASNTPGRTRELNFFSVDDRLTLVDMPGYGFASASGKDVKTWQSMMRGLPARPRQPDARLCARRCAPRHHGGRPRNVRPAGRSRRHLPDRAHQGRQAEAQRAARKSWPIPRRPSPGAPPPSRSCTPPPARSSSAWKTCAPRSLACCRLSRPNLPPPALRFADLSRQAWGKRRLQLPSLRSLVEVSHGEAKDGEGGFVSS